jgi:GrxC family glutaredoxin
MMVKNKRGEHMNTFEIYTTGTCPFCVRAKALLQAKGLEYKEININDDPSLAAEMVERSNQRSVPQIFIDGESIGGYEDLVKLVN